MAVDTNTVLRRFAPVQCVDCSTSFERQSHRKIRCNDCQLSLVRKRAGARSIAVYWEKKAANPPMTQCQMCSNLFERRARKKFCDACKPIARKEFQSEWVAKNPEKNREKARLYAERNPEKVRARRAAYRERNPEKNKEYMRSAHRRELFNDWERKRRASDHRYVISKRISHGIRMSIKAGKAGRRWEALVGYSLNDLIQHLELQFTKGMTWENRGEWHIDHIVPLASFNYETPDCPDFKAAWALTNLRPLWKSDNLQKSGHRTHLL